MQCCPVPPRPNMYRLAGFINSLKLPVCIRSVRFFRCLITRMSIAAVRSIEGEDYLTISFTFDGKDRKMQRSKNEVLSKALKRIELSSKKKAKKVKRSADYNEIGGSLEGNTTLWFNGQPVDSSLTNEAAWKDGAILKIGSEAFTVEINPPTVTSLILPTNMMSGFPVMPSLRMEFGDKQFCRYKWFKSSNHSDEQASSVPASSQEVLSWEEVGNDFLYTPSVLDVGCYLKLACAPGNAEKISTITSEATTSVTVAAGPGECPFDKRHKDTTETTADSSTFRVVSYNILSSFAQKDKFRYCPSYASDISYRQQLLLKEIPGYNADLICLQECGPNLFRNNLTPALETMGFKGLLKCKADDVPEGEATFFRESKFTLINQYDIVLNEALHDDPAQAVILDHVSAIPILHETLQKRNAVAQVSILKVLGIDNRYLCVANTHLYYKPTYPHIRLLQAAIILNHLKKVISQELFKVAEDGTHDRPQIAVVFCGDFNSLPESGLVKLLTTSHIDSLNQDWTVCEDKKQHCSNLNISHDFNLFSACSFPSFTNYTYHFKGTLDYIFADGKYLEVKSVVPLPSEEELSLYKALPSVVMPSDHLALVCDLKWKL